MKQLKTSRFVEHRAREKIMAVFYEAIRTFFIDLE